MPSTCDGAESSSRRSTSLNRRPGFHDGGRRGTAWSSSGCSRRVAAGPANCHERVLSRAASALVSLDVSDDVLDGANLLGVLVGDFDVELLFQRHYQLDDVERIRAEVLDERGLRSYLVGSHTQLLADLLANLGFDVLSHRALVPPGSEPSMGRQSIFQHYPLTAKTRGDGEGSGSSYQGSIRTERSGRKAALRPWDPAAKSSSTTRGPRAGARGLSDTSGASCPSARGPSRTRSHR